MKGLLSTYLLTNIGKEGGKARTYTVLMDSSGGLLFLLLQLINGSLGGGRVVCRYSLSLFVSLRLFICSIKIRKPCHRWKDRGMMKHKHSSSAHLANGHYYSLQDYSLLIPDQTDRGDGHEMQREILRIEHQVHNDQTPTMFIHSSIHSATQPIPHTNHHSQYPMQACQVATLQMQSKPTPASHVPSKPTQQVQHHNNWEYPP